MAKQRTGSRLNRRVELITSFADHLEDSQRRQVRTDALRLARAIALAGLPKKRSGKQLLERTLRLGADTWLRVTYRADSELPFGEDRFVLAGIQHLALEQDSPVVYFERVGQLLRMFGLVENGQNLELLRQRFRRIAGLSIKLSFAHSEAELDDNSFGDQIFVIRRYALPTRKDLRAERIGQQVLPALVEDPDLAASPYGVVLSRDFWAYLVAAQNQMIVPLDLLRLFIDRPVGWDYACFLVARCGRARSSSVVPHDVLMSLFRDGKEPDRNAIARLKRYHDEIMLATKGRLKASIVHDGFFPSTGRGRPKKRWVLKVGKSDAIISSGKDVLPRMSR